MKKVCGVLFLFSLFAILARAGHAQTSAPNTPGGGRQEVSEDEVVRVDTTLVAVPVSVMDRHGKFVPHLRREDFRIYEDGVEQQIAYFAPVEKPFTVVLMLDTSGSTRFQLKDIQDAAIAFVEHLRADDRVAVVSFNDRVEVMTEATSDREALRRAIRSTTTREGTHLYDAVDFVVKQQLGRISGRKAVVLFTDGVDNVSLEASGASTVRDTEESDVLVYSVQYDTSIEVVRAVRVSTSIGLNSPSGIALRRTREYPPGFDAKDYERGKAYLREIALKTGARFYHADDLKKIAQAFARIAEELRWQYSLGYYPTANAQSGGPRRRIKVRVEGANLTVRARDGYVYASPSAPK